MPWIIVSHPPLVVISNWCREKCVAKASQNWKHKTWIVNQYNVSPITMGWIPLDGLVMVKRWVAPRYVGFDVGKQSWNNYRNPFANLPGENNLEGVQKPSQKGHLQINAGCVRMSTLKSKMKFWGLGLVHGLLRKAKGSLLIQDVKQIDLRWCPRTWM